MAFTDINSEDRLVQQTFADHLRDVLGWDSLYAWNEETFGPDGTLGRLDQKEVVLCRDLRAAITGFNPALPEKAVDEAIEKLTRQDFSRSTLQHNREFHSYIRDGVPVSYRDASGQVRQAFARVIDAKSPFTHGHSARVALYTDLICTELGYAPEARRWMRRAALMHDIGKLGVSNRILDKPARLTDAEFDVIRRHPAMGEEILAQVDQFRPMARLAGAHHERLDGKGYPRGLRAPEISRDVRVLTVSDIFDALTAERPYRAATPLRKTYEIMDAMVGTAIDPECYAALKRAVAAAEVPGFA